MIGFRWRLIDAYRLQGPKRITLLLTLTLLLAACSSPNPGAAWRGPRIFSIGYTPSLSFSKADKSRPLVIPIEGLGLTGDREYSVSVSLNATHPISENDYTVRSPRLIDRTRDLSRLEIEIKPDYLQKVQTGDQLTITVHIATRPPQTRVDQAQRILGQAQQRIESLANEVSKLKDLDLQAFAVRTITSRTDFLEALAQNHAEQLSIYQDSVMRIYDEHKFVDEPKPNDERFKLPEDEQPVAGTLYDQQRYQQAVVLWRDQGYAIRAIANEIERLQRACEDIPSLKYDLVKNRNQSAEVRNLKKQLAQADRQIVELNRKDFRYRTEIASLRRSDDAAKQQQELKRLTQEQAQVYKALETAASDYDELFEQWITATEKDDLDFEESSAEVIEEAVVSLILNLESLVQATSASVEDGSLSEETLASVYKTNAAGLVPVVSSRDFTFYEIDDFRNSFQAARIRPDDISAFPLPAEEAVDLFGHYIASNYFVVRLSLRNTDQADKLVNTGMIRVSGRALVEVNLENERGANQWDKDNDPDVLRFTVPIDVTPHSKEQVYTVLDDTEVSTSRHTIFRALEFAGALAAGYTVAFIDSETTSKTVNLFNGIITPELKKLWADRYPDYKRNIVNYAMEDLVKVPAQGTTAHKFLFFPRSRIEAVVLDPNSYGQIAKGSGLGRGTRLKFSEFRESILSDSALVGFEQPETYVAYLVFDNMDIPLEVVTTPTDGRIADKAVRMNAQVLAEKSFRENMRDHWGPGKTLPSTVLKGLTFNTWQDGIHSQVNALLKKDTLDKLQLALSDENEQAKQTLEAIQALTQLLAPQGDWQTHLLKDLGTQTDDFDSYHDQLATIVRTLARGENPTQFRDPVETIQTRLEKARQIRAFYQSVGQLLNELATPDLRYSPPGANPATPRTPLQVLHQVKKDDEKSVQQAKALLAQARQRIQSLGQLRGDELKELILPGNSLLAPEPKKP